MRGDGFIFKRGPWFYYGYSRDGKFSRVPLKTQDRHRAERRARAIRRDWQEFPNDMTDRAYHRDYGRAWIAARRATWFAGKACARCGATQDLQLDHIDPEKKTSHNIWSWRPARIAEEAKLCQVLCKPCHRLKTNEELRTRARSPHGTRPKYRSGCRCFDCRRENADLEFLRRRKIRRERGLT